MKFAYLFLRRPTLAIVLNVLIAVGGIQAIRSLSVRQYPKTESATIVIRTAYIGANADLVRGFITVPIERAVAAADGIDYIESQSEEGFSEIDVRLRLNFPATDALADISSRVDQVRADLPPEAEIPTITIEPSDAQVAAMYMSFASSEFEDNEITDYLVREVQPRLSALRGVQRADILGGRTFAIRAWLDPDRMAALGVAPADIRRAIGENNYLAAVGETKGALVRIDLTASTDRRSLQEFRDLVVQSDGDTLVRLSDVANVELGSEDYDQEVRFSGDEAIFMGVWVLPNANTLEVIQRVRAEIQEVERELPAGMQAHIAYDSTVYIEDAMTDVFDTLLETILIVVIVITAFLGSLRSSIVPVIAIPLSLIGAVFLMQLFGFTLNLLTLLAVVLSVGLVVDDAIVVVENVDRHIRSGESRTRAAVKAVRELVGPIIAMTVTLLAVYVPIGFQGGLTGALFREFAFTLAGAIFISGIVALTLSPVMSARLLPDEPGRVARWIAGLFEAVRLRYVRVLDTSLSMRPAVYIVWIGLSLSTIPMFMFSPVELAPQEDQGVVFTTLDVPANASLERIASWSHAIQSIFQKDPDYDHSFQLTTPNGGFGGFVAVPWSRRTRTVFDMQRSIGEETKALAGVRAPMFLRPALPSPGTMPVEVVITSTADHSEIQHFTQEITDEVAESGQFAFPPLSNVHIDRQRNDFVLDRNQLATMGITMQTVGRDLSSMLSGNYVNRFSLDGRAYEVIPQIQRSSRLSPEQIERVHVTGPDGTLVPLGAVSALRQHVEPRALPRFQQLNAIKLSGIPTRSLDDALTTIEQAAADTLPPGYHVDYTGESRQLREEGGKFLPVFGLAILVVFLVLAAQLDSFRDPFVILAGSVPLALFGALIFTFLHFDGPPGVHFGLTEGWTTTMNIYSQVGLVTLAGLISKNAILIVSFANERQKEGLSKVDAVRDAASTRLRPILMTTAATVAGHFPLTLVTGPGAAARNSIGIVLVGGMAIGTLFTLFVVPSVYVLVAKTRSSRTEPEPGLG